MADKFCYSCGTKMAAECTFCPNCGANQTASGVTPAQQPVSAQQPAAVQQPGAQTSPVQQPVYAAVQPQQPKKNGTKIVLIIIGAVIAVALIVLCIILGVNSTNSGNSGSTGGSGISFPSDNGGSTGGNNIASPAVSKINPYANVNGGALKDVEAAFSSTDGYVVIGISGMGLNGLDDVGGVAAVVIDESACRAGLTITERDSSSSSYFDIILMEGMDAEEYTTETHSSMFDDCTFELLSYDAGSSATFRISVEFTYDGENFCFEGGATVDYTAYDQGNAGVVGGSTGGYEGGYTGGYNNSMCAVCYGSGECSICDGSGLNSYFDWGTGVKSACDSCNGSTRCIYCGGDGYC